VAAFQSRAHNVCVTATAILATRIQV
jgi:hypothetical protein